MAGEKGLEPPTDGFGDRYSANCATPLRACIVYNISLLLVNGTNPSYLRCNIKLLQPY